MFKLSLSPHMSITISKNQTEKHVKNPSKSNTTMSILSILREALKICFRNGKIMVSIFLSEFLSYSLLTYDVNLVLSPLLEDLLLKLSLIGKYQKGSEVEEFLQSGIRKDIRHFLVLQSVDWFSSYVIRLFFLVAIISLSSEAYTGKKVSAKYVFSRVSGRWRRPVISSVYMALISISLIVLFLVVIGLIPIMAEGVLLVGLFAVAAILGAFCYLYVAAVWMLNLVVSKLEDASCGLKAIDRGRELMKGKRVFQGCAMKLVLVLTSGAIHLTAIVKIRNSESDLTTQAMLAILIPLVFVACLVKFIMLVMYTVFYHECKMSHEEVGSEGELDLYAPIASTEA